MDKLMSFFDYIFYRAFGFYEKFRKDSDIMAWGVLSFLQGMILSFLQGMILLNLCWLISIPFHFHLPRNWVAVFGIMARLSAS